MKGFIYGRTKCDICGHQMRPKKNFYRITIGCYDNDHPDGGVEGLYDLCPNCCHEVCDFLDDLISRKDKGGE